MRSFGGRTKASDVPPVREAIPITSAGNAMSSFTQENAGQSLEADLDVPNINNNYHLSTSNEYFHDHIKFTLHFSLQHALQQQTEKSTLYFSRQRGLRSYGTRVYKVARFHLAI